MPAHATRDRSTVVVVVAAVVLAAGVVERLWNAWNAPVLAGYDSFGHFTYVWFVAVTGSLPMPTHGWSFFHPPLWYAAMAALWDALPSLDPSTRLRLGKLAVAALGTLHAAVAWRLVKRRLPGDRAARWMAAALAMATPVQLYSAGFLGNEGLHAVLGALSILALARVLERPSTGRAAALGLALGLAMLAKFSAVAVVAGAVGALALQALRRRGRAGALAGGAWRVAVCVAVTVAVAGPWYGRSLAAYGTPFQMSRDQFLVAYVEGNQPQAARGLADYLTFDPMIFRRPVWPRGSTPTEDASPYGFERAVRESVWTGLYANTWFDGFGGWVLPSVTESEGARRSGQALLVLGLVPTLLMGIGFAGSLPGLLRGVLRALPGDTRDDSPGDAPRDAAARRPQGGHDGDATTGDDTTAACALLTASMLALFVYGTHAAPIAAAVKATYFTPIAVVFAYWFGLGIHRAGRWRPALRGAAEGACGLLAAVALPVFLQGFLFDTESLGMNLPRFQDAKAVQLGVVEYAGGRVDAARRAFEQAAASNYHLAWENLAFLEIDAGRPRRGLKLLRRAARTQRVQLDAGPREADRFLRLALAEYDHSMAVVLHGIGGGVRARRLWHRAIALDPVHAEALYCLTLARLEDSLADAAGPAERAVALDEAARALTSVRALDPGFDEPWALAAAVEASRGDCAAAKTLVAEQAARPAWVQRRFPAETGTGAGLSASIGRRRLIRPSLAETDVVRALAACDFDL